MNDKQLKWLSYITCAVMFFATFGGMVVTKTDSGLGCGQEWPLCNGKFIPAYTVSSLIEYSHRAVSGMAGLAALASLIAFWRYKRDRKDLMAYVVMTSVFVIVQAIMGALAVVKPQSAAVMALHFGFSLIAFASSVMLALGMRRVEKAKMPLGSERLPRVSNGFRRLVWGATIYTYIVVYIGAFVSHTDSREGCSGWPLCNGEVIPELGGGVGIAFMHRVAALLLLIVVAVMGHFAYWRNRDNREIQMLGVSATVLCLLQIFSGAIIMATMHNDEVYVFSALGHTLLISALFGVLSYLSVRVWQLRELAPVEQQGELELRGEKIG
ncbi:MULTISPECIES: COX15/CtaA family protein [Paenibacillus]|uniref:Cytochrome oxidase assembly n=2 Tax=Paenibacillus lactis TaxID=228574 RepID=G4HLF8_9BACL|nr:COX15/CtaA family protein [Paenibacillus lactis]EHB56884.1 cytochrome oxidase assembly [Paenibacillus lactis 154]MBP1892597.1 cytochrome c oxidase assembly protein subunit 15 [Paenibacillus lactis]GIO93120.1 heme A synthase [Paenibacillus lactis]HAF97154.1 heme A synthase [Paenibacillus lactis]